jgi:hypothetical protein
MSTHDANARSGDDDSGEIGHSSNDLASKRPVVEEPADAAPPAGDRRRFVRVRPNDVPWLDGAKLKYGPPVQILDISAGGMLLGTRDELTPGSTIVIELSRAEGPLLVALRVRRCEPRKHEFDWYRSGCQFKRPFDVPGLLHLRTREPITSGRVVEPDTRPDRQAREHGWWRRWRLR